MKNFITNSDLIRVTDAIPPEMNFRNRSPWRAGFFLIAFALTWVGLSPTARAVDPSLEPNQNSFIRSYRDAILADSPIMYWRLGETAGPFAYDESGYRRDATYIGNPALGLHGAIVDDTNTSAGFNGINQYVGWNPTPSTSGASSCSGTFTVEAWVKEKKVHLAETFFSTRTGTAEFSFDLKFDTITLDAIQKEIRIDVGDGTQWLSISRVPFDYKPQVWYYVAAVVTPTGATYYVDGSAIGSASYSGTPLLFDSTHKVEIGANTGLSAVNEQVDSAIDEVAVYEYALTADQIAVHYMAGHSPPE